MYPVESHTKVRNPRSRALTGLQFGEPRTAVLIKSAQGVEFGVETSSNHAAVANLRTRFVRQLLCEQTRR